MTLVAANNISVTHKGTPALSNVTMQIEQGEIVTVVGPNGSGKSTLMRTIIGALTPDTGQLIRKDGLRIGYVPQGLSVDSTLPMTVARFLNLPKRQKPADVIKALAACGATGWEKRAIDTLSGGQLQRVMLARAVLGDPELLILDEPTTGLDQKGAAAFYQQIAGLRDQMGCAVLMVSHELHVVMSASDRVICLNGHVCCHGTPEIVASAPEYQALFGTGTQGALALYRHDHDHDHHDHHHDETCNHA